MNGVLGMTELLLGTPLSVQQQRFTAAAYQSGAHLLQIIDAILDFSKIEAGRLELERIDFNLRELVEDLGLLFATQAAAKELDLICAIPHDLPVALRGDQVRLRQILTNLVGNAIKFTQQGEVVVEIRLLQESDAVAELRFEVRDTGIGIAPAAQQRIFEAFAQADNSTTRRFGGTGLGLTIARKLVEAMHGQLHVDSQPQQGTSFHFDIALDKQNAYARMVERSRRPGELTVSAVDDNAAERQIHKPPGLQGRVLLVEDHPVNRQLACAMLEEMGLTVAVANDGREALRALEHATFDSVLMDCQMPEMDGFAATAAIRDAERRQNAPRLPIIALTANAIQDDRNRCLAAGMDDYLSKPFTQAQLRATLARWLPVAAPQTTPPPETAPEANLIADEALNPAALAAIRRLDPNGKKGLVAKVIRSYLDDAPPRLASMHAALRDHDAKTLRKAAHAMKSASANLGADRLAAQLKELETLARGEMTASEYDAATAAVSATINEYSRIAAALRQLDELAE